MKPAQFSYAAPTMKSAESSAGSAPPMFVTQLGALSMMAAIGFLPEVAPALLARGPLHGPAHDGEHDGDGDGEGQHRVTSSACRTAGRAGRWSSVSGPPS